MYGNGKMRLVDIILRRRRRRIKENDGEMNLTKIYCKHFCKCHIAHPVPQQYDDKNLFKIP
jgi:hypothetical protein